jgi:hypothetical protein
VSSWSHGGKKEKKKKKKRQWELRNNNKSTRRFGLWATASAKAKTASAENPLLFTRISINEPMAYCEKLDNERKPSMQRKWM